jgi:site-specific recombinase XerD
MSVTETNTESKVRDQPGVFYTDLNVEEIEILNRLFENRLAKNTQVNYKSDINVLTKFINVRFPGLTIDRMKGEHLLAFFVDQLKLGRSLNTIERRYNSFKKHQFSHFDAVTWKQILQIMGGVRREGSAEKTETDIEPTRLKHKPILHADLVKLLEFVETPRERALFSFAYYSAMRRSEIADLIWLDLTVIPDTIMSINIRKSKTDQLSAGKKIAVNWRSESEAAFCPVRLMLQWKSDPACKSAPSDSVFGIKSKQMYLLLKRALEAAGYNPKEYAMHQFRAGYITDGAQQGIPLITLMGHARHRKLDTTAIYVKETNLASEASISGRL